MQSFHRLFLILGCLALAAGAVAQQKSDKTKTADKTKQEAKKKTGKGEPAPDAAAAAEKEKEAKRLPFPLPIGHGGKGLVIPYMDGTAKKTMNFVVGSAERTDADTVEMGDLKIETFGDDENAGMIIAMSVSKLNLTTRVISTEKGVHIKCPDYELTGDRMVFDTTSKEGTLEGHVRMVIPNHENEPKSDAAPKPKQEPKPGE